MAYENFLTYEKVDDADALTVVRNKINYDNMPRGGVEYIRKKFANNKFSDITFRYKFYSVNQDENLLSLVTLLNEDSSTGYDAIKVNDDGFGNMLYTTNDPFSRIYVYAYDNLDNKDICTLPSFSTPFWVELKRVGVTISSKIYSDEFITLVDTIVAESTDTKYSIIMALCNRGGVGLSEYTGYVENLNIGMANEKSSRIIVTKGVTVK